MRPAALSATKMSPFGATRTMRGLVRPVAKRRTVKPAGTRNAAPGGGLTTLGPLPTDWFAYAGGRSAGAMRCTTPGASAW